MEELLEKQAERKQFSVLMSVYYKEKPDFFDRALESIYNQTIKADEWVIVKDGAISQELQDVIDKYKQLEDVNIKEVQLEENKGLGVALSIGIPECGNELIARMDTDDIAVPNRFELQLNEFEKDPDLDLCGGQIIEFESDENIAVAERRVPLSYDKIVKYQKSRSAFNHMTVMYKKSKVLAAGNYKDCPLMEDDMLWVEMIMTGAHCMNVEEYLCKVRTNIDMIIRRGGLKYFKKYSKARKKIYKTGFISLSQYLKTNFVQFCVCIMPKFIRKFVFFKLLHKKNKREAL